MSDFQDFLKHALVHVSVGEFKPGKFAEAQRLYEEAISTYNQGFKGAYLLREPGTDRGISLIFWDSAEDMGNNQSALHAEIVKKMAPLFVAPPTITLHEVVTHIVPDGDHQVYVETDTAA